MGTLTFTMRERRERGGHTHPQELPSLSLITAILGLVVAKQLWNVPEKQSALLHPSCLSGSPGAQLLPTWILFIVNPDPCKSHFPVFLPPQSLLPSIRAWLPIVQLSECQLVSCQLLSRPNVISLFSLRPWSLFCAELCEAECLGPGLTG